MHGSGGCGLGVNVGNAQVGLGGFDQNGLVVHVVFEALRRGSLGVTVVHHLIQQLVHQDKVLADRFLHREEWGGIKRGGFELEAEPADGMERVGNTQSGRTSLKMPQ